MKNVDLEPSNDKIIKEIELKTHKDEAGKIKSGLDELKILKINAKEDLEEIGLQLMNLKENESIERLKIEVTEELEIEFKKS